MTTARKNLIDPSCTPYYHCMRAVYAGHFSAARMLSGKSYEHRRQWVADRLKELPGFFSLEICAYAVMSNHYHVVLHINREQAEGWSTEEVLNRWAMLFNGAPLVQRFLAGDFLDKSELHRVDEYAEEYRKRLMDISWFMRCLNEHLAREANKEDGCKGRFYKNHLWFLPFGPAKAVQIFS